MTALIDWLQAADIGRYDTLLRMVGAAFLGGVIGLEREASGKPAGFRTNLLICLGSALIMELSIRIAVYGAGTPGGRGDPGRIAAQIVSGIGFLGAGTILHFRGSVIGLTTAATLWVVAAIGMAVGAKAYVEAVAATVLVMLALRFLERIEERVVPHRPRDRTIDLELKPDGAVVGRIEELLIRAGLSVGTIKVEKNSHVYLVTFQARGHAQTWDRAMHELLSRADVLKVELT